MALVELAAQLRMQKGRGAARRIRREGLLPGIVYSAGEEGVKIAIEARRFDKILRDAAGGTVLIDLKVSGDKERSRKVLIKEVQRDPATSRPLHVDLLNISMGKVVQLVIPVHLTGVPEGVKNEGGFVDHVLREVEVECLPAEIPETIEMDVTGLHVGDSLHAADIQQEGIRLLTPPDRVIVAVHGQTISITPEEEAAALAEAEEGAAAEEPAKEEAADEKMGSKGA